MVLLINNERSEVMLYYREIKSEELNIDLFANFVRRQIVTKCWRKRDGQWTIEDDPFIDDWTREEYGILIGCLKNTLATGGFVYGAFIDEKLKGFVSVESEPLGSRGQYMDLSSIHVSQDQRGHGIGRELFVAAGNFAREKGAEKLYISSHSAAESQAFYKAMGCVEAEEYNAEHTEREPYDCQLECSL